MKKLIFGLIAMLSLTSCTAVKFENPQPAGISSLTEFPQEMQGFYTSGDGDTLEIFSQSFNYYDGQEIDLKADLEPSTAVLKRVKNRYVLSLKDNSSWDVFPIKVFRNKIIVYYVDLDERTGRLLDINDSAVVKQIRTGEDKFDHYLINPSEREFKKLLRKKLFSQNVEFKKLKRT